jgi:YlmC/YmxH family sporulation protein
MRICELRQKEVINICSCRSLGCVLDLDLNTATGCINALIVPDPGKFWGIFGSDKVYVIPWNCIRQIGCDIILVEINEEICCQPGEP